MTRKAIPAFIDKIKLSHIVNITWKTLSGVNHLAVQTNPAPVSAAEPFFQVLKVTMGNNPNEVADYSITVKQIRIKQNLERK